MLVDNHVTMFTERHQVIAQAATPLRLNCKRARHVLRGNKLGLDQQIPQPHTCLNGAPPAYNPVTSGMCGNRFSIR